MIKRIEKRKAFSHTFFGKVDKKVSIVASENNLPVINLLCNSLDLYQATLKIYRQSVLHPYFHAVVKRSKAVINVFFMQHQDFPSTVCTGQPGTLLGFSEDGCWDAFYI